MRLKHSMEHPSDHNALSNVSANQHHDQPENIQASNTALTVYPLPSGPYAWDIPMPLNARVVKFSLRSGRTCAEGGGKAGVHGIATRSALEATTVSLGGDSSIARTAYNAIYSKQAAAMNLSHKVFNSGSSASVCLTDAYIHLVSASVRVLRLLWTNYGSSVETLNCWAEIQVVG